MKSWHRMKSHRQWKKADATVLRWERALYLLLRKCVQKAGAIRIDKSDRQNAYRYADNADKWAAKCRRRGLNKNVKYN